ncbi:Centrosomal protein of 120 kDa [Phytophthora ramorum]|uniref:Centrosomal protein of 120 kDa n=1 Tax=Phytophthora ramorum TaxID=164328 RepID=UPI00309D178B|nr:Centrosomal protein of 120 kDa [Phytophthora ramorum]
MSDPDQEDEVYASDDYELESPTRLQETNNSDSVPQQQQQTLRFESDAFDDDASDAGAVTPLPKTKPKRSRPPRDSNTVNGRHLMDNTPWTYTVSALQVRMLRIPVAESAAIRELRVFATLDKQAAQSKGSRWKQELQSLAGGSPLRSVTKKKSSKGNAQGGGRVEPYRRSGLIEEAKWVRGDGKLQWTFPMEKFRRMKAYAPRIKAFVYGIGEAGVETHSRGQMENLARQEKDGAILSFGWFFLDLRTPDLPERWLRLQNSPFGGEILISSIFSPKEILPAKTPPKRLTLSENGVPSENATLAGNRTAVVPNVVPGGSGEYLQIGDSNGQEIFVLSIFIQEALNISSDASGERHHYRMCLRLKSVRDIELPGGYSLRYQNPFLKSASINSDWFNVQSKEEVDTSGFYCVFDLTKDPLQLKQEMHETVSIDVISGDEERVGGAIFSLSYLFFSEERFCCSEDTCEEVFMTQAETEAHWLEVHTEAKLPDTKAGPEAYAHSYRSCSINIPIVSGESAGGSARQERVGSVRVSAYLEDIGLATENSAEVEATRFLLPPVPLQEKEASRGFSSVEATLVTTARKRSESTSVVREAEETSRYTSVTRGPSTEEISNSRPDIKTDRSDHNREQLKEAAEFREVLERERSAWKQEQHLQQLQWKRRFAEMEKARMDELEEEWARREEERSNLLKSAQEEYQRLEQALRKSLAELETRERRLAIAEAALQREQEAKRDESESLQRRLKSEQSHTLSLAKKQTEAYERRIALLESQLSEAERRAKQVENDFAEYRQQQRKLPESRLREEIAALRGNVAELDKQKMAKERECEVAEVNIGNMKAQLEQMSTLLMQEKKKHEARAVDELEKLRVKYIAREEKYVLDGDRDELRAIKKQLDDLKGFNLRGVRARSSSRRNHRSRESSSPQHRHNQWHTQSRQGGHIRSASQRYEYPGSSFHSDHAPGNESDWEESSFVEIDRGDAAPKLNHVATTQREFSRSQTGESNLQETPIPDSEDGEGGKDELGSSAHSYEDTELGRLTRERKLLLASGAYDAQSYLVQELDRLIRVTQANAEHRTSVA